MPPLMTTEEIQKLLNDRTRQICGIPVPPAVETVPVEIPVPALAVVDSLPETPDVEDIFADLQAEEDQRLAASAKAAASNGFDPYDRYMRSLFAPDDVVSFAFMNHDRGNKIIRHEFLRGIDAFNPGYFKHLQEVNAGLSVYVAMNPFKPELIGKSVGRTKNNVAKIKRLYAEVDDNGPAVLDKVLASKNVPPPNVILESSPEKFQFIWNIEEMTQDVAEGLLDALVQEFNTDPNVAETARVLRVPGLKNHKYADAPEVKVIRQPSNEVHPRSAFNLQVKPVGKFTKKPEGWIYEPLIHKNPGINDGLTKIAGWYIQNKNINDAEILYTLLAKHAENQAVHQDGKTPFICNQAEIHQIAEGAVSRWKTGEEKRNQKALMLNQNQQTPQTQNPQAGDKADVSNWLSMFRSVGEMEEGNVVMVIDGVLQEGTCFIGANPGDGKTLVGLAFAKAISTGTPLFGMPEFLVKEPRTVIYLIPESRDRAFRKRCEAFHMPDDKAKFMARTISVGVSLELGDPYLLEAVRQTKAVVFLDTASRFMKGSDENAAAQNRQLVNDVIALLAAGAVSVVLIHHATKAAKAKRETMTLENMLRGSSDLGAMCDQAYGIRKDMLLYANGAGPMEIDMVNLKDREQIGGLTSVRLAASYKKDGMDFPMSYINEVGNFRVINNIETYKRNIETLIGLVKADPNIPAKELAIKTGLTDYGVKHKLGALGWHRVQGGPAGASPWHLDNGQPCPFAKVKAKKAPEASKTAKAGITEAVA